jgi:hypothetical protein
LECRFPFDEQLLSFAITPVVVLEVFEVQAYSCSYSPRILKPILLKKGSIAGNGDKYPDAKRSGHSTSELYSDAKSFCKPKKFRAEENRRVTVAGHRHPKVVCPMLCTSEELV